MGLKRSGLSGKFIERFSKGAATPTVVAVSEAIGFCEQSQQRSIKAMHKK